MQQLSTPTQHRTSPQPTDAQLAQWIADHLTRLERILAETGRPGEANALRTSLNYLAELRRRLS